MAEATLNQKAKPAITAYTAGSFPTAKVLPDSFKQLDAAHIPTAGLRSKSGTNSPRCVPAARPQDQPVSQLASPHLPSRKKSTRLDFNDAPSPASPRVPFSRHCVSRCSRGGLRHHGDRLADGKIAIALLTKTIATGSGTRRPHSYLRADLQRTSQSGCDASRCHRTRASLKKVPPYIAAVCRQNCRSRRGASDVRVALVFVLDAFRGVAPALQRIHC